VLQFRIEGKGEKVHYVPVGMKALRLITEYLEAAGHKEDLEGPLFRPVQNRVTGELNKPLYPVSVYQDIVKRYGQEVGITADVRGFCVHSLRATAATNALAHGADIAKVQEWLGHADISTTRMYDAVDKCVSGDKFDRKNLCLLRASSRAGVLSAEQRRERWRGTSGLMRRCRLTPRV